MGESDNDSWSVVGDDDSVEDRSPAAGHSQHSDENNAGDTPLVAQTLTLES